jgi:hypothetical protein
MGVPCARRSQRVRDVVRTKQEGLFQGDPFALLVEEPRGAGGELPGWDQLARFLEAAGGLYGGAKALQAAAERLLSVVRTCRRQWEIRFATPKPFLDFILRRESWDYARLAGLLNVSFSTVVDLLVSLGYEQDAEGGKIYRLPPSAAATDLRSNLERDFLHGNPRNELQSFWLAQGTQPPSSE